MSVFSYLLSLVYHTQVQCIEITVKAHARPSNFTGFPFSFSLLMAIHTQPCENRILPFKPKHIKTVLNVSFSLGLKGCNNTSVSAFFFELYCMWSRRPLLKALVDLLAWRRKEQRPFCAKLCAFLRWVLF